jgi:hypothetical protein
MTYETMVKIIVSFVIRSSSDRSRWFIPVLARFRRP